MLIMKTLIQKLLVGAALVGAATLVQAAQFSYNDNGDGTCTIAGYIGPDGGVVTIPYSINGLIVVSIGDSAFTPLPGLIGISSVTMGNSVTSIGIWAFGGCTGLTNVAIPSVTSIGA